MHTFVFVLDPTLQYVNPSIYPFILLPKHIQLIGAVAAG